MDACYDYNTANDFVGTSNSYSGGMNLMFKFHGSPRIVTIIIIRLLSILYNITLEYTF